MHSCCRAQTCDFVSCQRRFFKTYFLDACLELTSDPVANVRLHLASLLPALKQSIRSALLVKPAYYYCKCLLVPFHKSYCIQSELCKLCMLYLMPQLPALKQSIRPALLLMPAHCSLSLDALPAHATASRVSYASFAFCTWLYCLLLHTPPVQLCFYRPLVCNPSLECLFCNSYVTRVTYSSFVCLHSQRPHQHGMAQHSFSIGLWKVSSVWHIDSGKAWQFRIVPGVSTRIEGPAVQAIPPTIHQPTPTLYVHKQCCVMRQVARGCRAVGEAEQRHEQSGH